MPLFKRKEAFKESKEINTVARTIKEVSINATLNSVKIKITIGKVNKGNK